MAELLSESKLESARIRVENIIRSDIATELHEILELYCELLLARIGLLEQIPNWAPLKKGEESKEVVEIDSGLDEAVRAVVYAAVKVDVKELSIARALLVEKFGKDFAAECAAGTKVPERVLSRLKVETPRTELVEAYLREIARTYGVSFPGDKDEDDEEVDEAEDDDEGGGGKALEDPLQAEELEKAVPPKDSMDKPSPIHIAPPSPTTENVSPSVRLPGDAKGVRPPGATRKTSLGVGASKGKAKEKSSTATGGPGGKIPDVDELAKRFAALKRT